MSAKMSWGAKDRLGGLRRFAVAITALNVLGHTWFGFEQSLAQPLVSLAAAYGMELLLEWLGARIDGRAPADLRSVSIEATVNQDCVSRVGGELSWR